MKIYLPEHYIKIVEMRKSGMTFEKIGQLMGFSRQRAWQLYQRALKRIIVPVAA